MTLKEITAPDLIDLFEQIERQINVNINCVKIGRIESFDASEQTASISIQQKKIKSIENDGTRVLQDYSVLLRCPIVVLSGGNSRITFPVEQGDTCLILFNDREIDNWFFDGNVQAPTTLRTHDLSDGFAIVGIRNLQNSIQDYAINETDWRYNATSKITQSSSQTTISNTNIALNGVVSASSSLSVTGILSAGNGASGTFLSQDGKTVSVSNGIITSII